MNPSRPGPTRPRLPRALASFLALVSVAALATCFAAFAAGSAAASEDPPLVRRTVVPGLTWETDPPVPCGGREVALRFNVCECQVDLLSATRDSVEGIVVHVRANPGIVCATCNPDSASVPLGTLPAGTHAFQVRFDIEYVSPPPPPPDTTWPSSPAFDVLTFQVGPNCPPYTPIPYLEQVTIEGSTACPGCLPKACPGDSIDVRLSGRFLDDCTVLTRVSLAEPLETGPLPRPPIIVLTYGNTFCQPCHDGNYPWTAHVRLPPLPHLPGFAYQLPVEARSDDLCTIEPDETFLARTTYPFTVADSCSTSVPPPPLEGCYAIAWRPVRDPMPVPLADAGDRRIGCTATWVPGGSSWLDLAIGARTGIAGVEGRLRLENPGALRVAGVRALLPGWQVALSNDGSNHFIAIASPGAAPIPGSETGVKTPFLRVEVAHNPLIDVVTPEQVRLLVEDLIVSDRVGRGIDSCPEPALYPPSNIATLCRRTQCDANADGSSDVRDLVVMINCLGPPSNAGRLCPFDSVGTALDCDGSGAFSLDDVFCCVRSMLGGSGPPDSTRREAPEIALRFGVPQPGLDGTIEVPLLLGGMSAVAAARLDVTYPDARYEVVDVSFTGTPSSWWTLHEASGGHARLAILDLAALDGDHPVPLSDPDARAILKLRLRDGASPGGELSIASSDFAAGDGIGLATPNASARLALTGGRGIALSTPRPNPFANSTAFALTVPTAGPVDVAVFAANGRRVATLLREDAAAAGVYDLAWDGRQDAGGRAPAGVYFVRVVTGPNDGARKVLLLPGGAR